VVLFYDTRKNNKDDAATTRRNMDDADVV